MRRASILLIVIAIAGCLVPPGDSQFQPIQAPEWSTFESREDLTSAGALEGAERVVRFVQVSDAHIIDDDAPYPMRQEVLDQFGDPFTSAQRPQEEYTDEVLQSIIRQINAIHVEDGLDFVINTGDNIDNQLENELMRYIDNWEGTHTTTGPVSGLQCVPDGQSESIDDSENDETDQCTSLPEAVAANNTPLGDELPWYSAFGNHDGLIQGNSPNEPGFQEAAAEFGRYFLPQHQYVGMHFAAGQSCTTAAPAGVNADDMGHGYGFAGERLCDDDPDNDGYYSFTLRGVHFVVLDTVNDDFVTGNDNLAGLFNPEATIGNDVVGGYAEGSIDPVQFEWLQQEIEENQDKAVVLFSHHTINSMFSDADSSQFDDENCQDVACLHDLLRAAGYKTHDEVLELLSGKQNVMAWIGGHTHKHRVQVKAAESDSGFWNVETSSLIDFPQEARVIELWKTQDGKLYLALDPFTHDFQLSKDLAATEPEGQGHPEGAGEAKDQRVLLWQPLSEDIELTPQPSLPREILLTRADDAVGQAGEPFTFRVQATDPLRDLPVPGLALAVDIGHPGTGAEASFTQDVPAGTPMNETDAGVYGLTFTPPEQGTYFATVTATDPVGLYDETVQAVSIRVEGDTAVDEESPLPLFTAVAALGIMILVARRQNR